MVNQQPLDIGNLILTTLRQSHKVIPKSHNRGDQTFPYMSSTELLNKIAGSMLIPNPNYKTAEDPGFIIGQYLSMHQYKMAIDELLEEGKICKNYYHGPDGDYEVIALN